MQGDYERVFSVLDDALYIGIEEVARLPLRDHHFDMLSRLDIEEFLRHDDGEGVIIVNCP